MLNLKATWSLKLGSLWILQSVHSCCRNDDENDLSIVDDALIVLKVGAEPLFRMTAPIPMSHSSRVSPLVLSCMLPHIVLHVLESMTQM